MKSTEDLKLKKKKAIIAWYLTALKTLMQKDHCELKTSLGYTESSLAGWAID